jgi:uncharacterized protein YjcR
MTNNNINDITPIIVLSDGETFETIEPGAGVLVMFPTEDSLDKVLSDEIDAADAEVVRPNIILDLEQLKQMMSDHDEINVLRKAGYFKDGDDALSLLASVDSLNLDLESALAKAEAESKAAEEMFKRIAELESKIVTLESRIRSMGGSV